MTQCASLKLSWGMTLLLIVFSTEFSAIQDKTETSTQTYSGFSWIYTCIYALHYHALAKQGQEAWVIYVNSLYGNTSGRYGPGSNSAVLELVAGDTVYLDINHHYSFLYGGGDEVYSTFSGYLLSLIDSHPRLLDNVF